MFKIVHERMSLSLSNQVPQRAASLVMTHIVSVVLALIIWMVWLLLASKEKDNVSRICGYTAQLPDSILSKKHVLERIKEMLSLG
jgi:hypothetical protein